MGRCWMRLGKKKNYKINYMMNLKQYVEELNKQYKTGIAREHSYRPALKDYLQGLLPNLVVTNEPAHIDCGAPDYIISREKDHLPVFFVEAKDVGDSDLDGCKEKGHKEQFDRYKQALDHILFTDYLDFHLYERGEFIDSVRVAEIKDNEIVIIPKTEEKFIGIIQYLGSSAIQSIGSATQLAKLMASKARLLANIIETAMNDDTQSYDNDNLQGQYNAFKEVLIQDLEKSDFADIYAQTIAYGMFAARLHDETPQDFSREEAARLIPKTNPFLRQIFNNLAGNDLDERIAWVVDDLVTVFRVTNIEKVMKNYKKNRRHHDPMIHFYEDFLTEYKPKLRKKKGVWYTPQAVVSFIVRAVDEILQTDFSLADGLADYSMIEREVSVEQSRDKRTTDGLKHIKKKFHRVQILDPATGTGTFLAEVVNQIYDRYRENQGIWQQYVEQHLLPRLNGFEILMASYAVAHLKLDMLLHETGYLHKSEHRLHVYLTNSLEESSSEPRTLFAQWLSREATEANIVKRDCPVMVMIGNPPYSVSSQNNGKWITQLISTYKLELNEKKINLDDDYIKFIRLGQSYVEKNGFGILAFITNNSFTFGLTHRQMRKELMKAFDKIFILNLHGDLYENIRDKDENVFDITKGVSINIFIKSSKRKIDLADVFYYDIVGNRSYKYDFLDNNSLQSIKWETLNPINPYYFFVPKDFSSSINYSGFKIDELMPQHANGIVSGKDAVNICDTEDAANQLLSDLMVLSKEEFRLKYKTGEDTDYWSVDKAKKDVASALNRKECIIVKMLFRPFDNKYIVYTGKSNGIIQRPINNNSKYMLNDNIGLVVPRQTTQDWHHVFLSKQMIDGNLTSSARLYGAGQLFPLYVVKMQDGKLERIPNLNEDIVRQIEQNLGEQIIVQEIFDYIYAILHSPSYRECYNEFLKIDFPRIPYPTDKEKYYFLVKKGAELRCLHLMEEIPNRTGVVFPIRGNCQVDYCQWHENRVYINNEQYFDGVPKNVWNFYIGSYQPAQKWLKDRKGSTLSFEDVRHYNRIIYVLQNTERIMQEIG